MPYPNILKKNSQFGQWCNGEKDTEILSKHLYSDEWREWERKIEAIDTQRCDWKKEPTQSEKTIKVEENQQN